MHKIILERASVWVARMCGLELGGNEVPGGARLCGYADWVQYGWPECNDFRWVWVQKGSMCLGTQEMSLEWASECKRI